MQTRTKAALVLLVGLAGLLAYSRLREAPQRIATPSASATAPSTPPSAVAVHPSASARPPASAIVVGDTDASPAPLVRARWGSGFDDLGHSLPHEGNPEAPMSIALAGDDVVILDQVNSRVVRYDRSGRRIAGQTATVTTQDIAIAEDGTVAMLDRLVDKKVTLVTPDQRRLEIPLAEGRTGEPGLITGLFLDGSDVYVEKEHGALVRVGTTDGKTDGEPKTLSGRPSKDGALLLTAALSDAAEGLVVLNAFDRKKGALRFARQLAFAKPVHGILLLDTDRAGTIYLGASAGAAAALSVVCMDPADGHVTGKATVPLSETPEESFRDFAVRPDGAIVYVHRTDEGVEVRTARCGLAF